MTSPHIDARGAVAPALDWRRILARVGVAYVVSRLCVFVGAGIVASQHVVDANRKAIPRPHNAVSLITQVLTSWDGRWYFEIVRHGYPREIPPNVTFDMLEARTAFFPVYPTLVRWSDKLLPAGDVFAGLALNLALGAVAVYLVGVLARELFGQRVAYRAMILMAVFPGSFVLSFSYSEATLLVLAAGCLLCLHRRQWVAAGVLAAVATATRPNGLALVAACAVASGIAISHKRDWRSLAAPVLAPVGFVGFQLFLAHQTGESDAWFRVQREAWSEGTSFGWSAISGTWEAFAHPLSSPTDFLTAASTITTGILIVAAWKRRLPWPLMAYSAAVLALMVLPSTVTSRPRFVYTAFPLFISFAAWVHDDDADTWSLVYVLSGGGLVALVALYGVFGAIP